MDEDIKKENNGGDADYRKRAETALEESIDSLTAWLNADPADEESAAVDMAAALESAGLEREKADTIASRFPFGGLTEEASRSVAKTVEYVKTGSADKLRGEKERNIHAGHRERMRATVRSDKKLDGFSDVGLIELLLSFIIPQKNTNPIAHKLLDRYGSVLGILRAPAEELYTFTNITANAAALLPLLGHICLWDGNREITIANSLDAADFFGSIYLGGTATGTLVAFLDSHYRLIEVEQCDEDDIVPATVALGSACKYAARYVIVVRREKDLYPDSFGLNVRLKGLTEALDLIGVKLLDLMLFTDYGYYTLGVPPKRGGWYPQYMFVPSRIYSRSAELAQIFVGIASKRDDGSLSQLAHRGQKSKNKKSSGKRK